MRLRFGLGAWSNAHFDNALFPIGTPHAEYLPRYATLFDCAEADILFHQALPPEELEHWVEQTPAGFLFLPKLHKAITHALTPDDGTREGRLMRTRRARAPVNPVMPGDSPEKTVRAAMERCERYLEMVEPLRSRGRLGPILLQVPPALAREKGWDLVQQLLATGGKGTFAVEVRDRSWFVPSFEAMLEDFDTPLVWSTYPEAFAPPWVTSGTGYVRFSGKTKPRRGRHVKVTDRTPEVIEMAKRLQGRPWKECFVIATNPFEGNAVDTLPGVATALGDAQMAQRLVRPPGQVLFPD